MKSHLCVYNMIKVNLLSFNVNSKDMYIYIYTYIYIYIHILLNVLKIVAGSFCRTFVLNMHMHLL